MVHGVHDKRGKSFLGAGRAESSWDKFEGDFDNGNIRATR